MYASRNIKTPNTQGFMLSTNAAAIIMPKVSCSTMPSKDLLVIHIPLALEFQCQDAY